MQASLLTLSTLALLSAPPDKAAEPDPPPDPAVEVLRIMASATEGATLDQIRERLAVLEPRKALPALVATSMRHYDERVRVASAHVLRWLGSRSSRQALAFAFGDRSPQVVIAAAQALHATGGKGSASEIRSLLFHESVKVRCAAADLIRRQRGRARLKVLEARVRKATLPEEKACLLAAVQRGGGRNVIPRVVPLLENPDTRPLGLDVMHLDGKKSLEVLGRILAGKASEEMVAGALSLAAGEGDEGNRWIAGLLDNRAPGVRRGALELLLSRGSNRLVRGLLLKSAADGEPAVRARVIEALTGLSEKALVPLARKWIGDRSPLVRAASAGVLAAMPSQKDATLLHSAYQNERASASDENLPVRVAILEAMSRLNKVDWVPLFVDASGQKGEEQVATDALVGIGKPAVRTLLLVVKIGDMDRVPYAMEALARIGHGVGDAAEGLFQHPRELVRELGRDLLAASGDPRAVGHLVRLYQSETLEDPVPLIQAIATFATPQARAALIDAADHPNDALRIAALKGLGEHHRKLPDTIAAILARAETDKVPAVRVAAVQALFQLNAEPLPALVKKMVAYEVPEVRTHAYEVLGWLGDPSPVPAMAARLRDAVGGEAQALQSALRRITRRTDLKSGRNYRDWYEKSTAALERRATGRPGTIQSGKAQVHYETIGGAGPTVLVLGGHHAGTVFAPALDPLKATNRVVYIDGRGRGQSTGGAGTNLGLEVNDIELVRRAVKAGRVHIVAHDAAAHVALAYARTYKKRVSRLILVSPSPRATRHSADTVAASRLKGVDALDLARLDARHAWFAPAAWLRYRRTALARGYVANANHSARLGMYPESPIARQGLERAVAGQSLKAALKATRARTWIIAGEHAALTGGERAALQKAARAHKHVAYRKMKKVGHYPHLEAPASFAAHVRSIVAPR